MAMEPEILILDEPTAGLDPRGRARLSDMIENYRLTTGKTVIIVSHSMDDVAAFASKVIVMDHGHTALVGTVGEVFRQVDRLLSIGLDVPQITRIFLNLKEQGLPVRTDIYTVEAAKRELLRVLKERGAVQ